MSFLSSAVNKLLKTLSRRKFNERGPSRKRQGKENKKTGKLKKAKLISKAEAKESAIRNALGNRPSTQDKFNTKQTKEAIRANNKGEVLPRAKNRTKEEALDLVRKGK